MAGGVSQGLSLIMNIIVGVATEKSEARVSVTSTLATCGL